MPRVYCRTAGKDYPEHGIKKGDTYYAWSFYRQRERKSLDRPKQSQLTQREELVALYSAQEIEVPEWEWGNRDACITYYEEVGALLEESRDAATDKAENIRSAFESGTELSEALDEFSGELEELIHTVNTLQTELEDAETSDDFYSVDEPSSIDWPELQA